ncbi:hypothetical protein QWY99_07720 [Flavobacterium branchiarum]|uniref:Uncharacterized protein n=1 Tax=Flavobacterium branchiarum TaxID=1114870 RepID=A0ABV5FRJ8_9FLAO|nr:hypothetical protein [Flavobacterium branchiarum]MDN3672938.1 hypothetical protein [Flavobacterium branchiarum]
MNRITMNLEKTVRIKTVIVLFLLGINFSSFAQERSSGINTLTPNAAAALEVFSTSKGFLPPRLTTNQRDAITVKPAGLMIYNSDINCLEFWNGVKWIEQCSSSEYPFFGDCTTGLVSGVFGRGVIMTDKNTLSVAVMASVLGPWSFVSDVINGISFSGNGRFTTTGVQNITLRASGTALTDGDFKFTLINGTSVCSKVITFSAPPPEPDLTLNRTGLKLPYSASGTVMNGTVTELPVSATFSDFFNIRSTTILNPYCGIIINDTWTLGLVDKSYMTIKFNRLVTNLKVFQVSVDPKEVVSYVLKRNGTVVPGKIQISTANYPNCITNFTVSGTEITCDVGRASGVVYNIGDVWFDEIEIKHNGEGAGSRFGFYLGAAKQD